MTGVGSFIGPRPLSQSLSASQKTVQLKWTSSPVEGRPEIRLAGRWFSVCVDRLPHEDVVAAGWPTVTCHQLGFTQGAKKVDWLAGYNIVAGDVSQGFYNPQCDGLASLLEECQAETKACPAGKQVVITCSGNVRFADSDIPGRGRAEFFNGHRWGTICDTVFARGGWPTIFCREMGYKGTAALVHRAQDDPKIAIGRRAITLMNPYCNTSVADTMEDCPTRPTECSHDDDVVVHCKANPDQTTTLQPTTTPPPDDAPTDAVQHHIQRLLSGSITSKKKPTPLPAPPSRDEVIQEILSFELVLETDIPLPPGVVESDKRPSAKAVGGIGVFLFSGFLVLILILDLPSFKRDAWMMGKNLRHGYRRARRGLRSPRSPRSVIEI